MKKDNTNKWLIVVLAVLVCIYLLGLKVEAEEYYNTPVILRCTCYIDDGITASGQEVRPFIIAGKREWLGSVACLNRVNEDGSIGEFIGYYEFCDTGYGRSTGQGQSKIKKGETLGTSEIGQTLDVWQKNMDAVNEWIKNYGDVVYVTIIPADG